MYTNRAIRKGVGGRKQLKRLRDKRLKETAVRIGSFKEEMMQYYKKDLI